MSLVKPFKGLRPAKGRADDVVAPPYDVLNSAEARERAKGKPYSFLHVSKPEIDLPEDIDVYDRQVYDKAAENLGKMIAEGIMVQDEKPCFYAYRIIMGNHIVTGIVAGASVADYDTNRIKKHEFTRPVKEDDRVNQITAVNAQTGPVMLVYPEQAEIDAIIDGATKTTPDIDVTADDGVQHMIWVMDDPEVNAQLVALFEALPNLYIADGHHRSASASRISKSRIEAGETAEDAQHRHFLSVIFPHHQMEILDYNRVITDLNDNEHGELLERIATSFNIEQESSPVRPKKPNEFGMYINGDWFRLRVDKSLIPQNDPVKRLDVSLLHDNLIQPFLGISDPRKDNRIDFVGGIRGLGELEKRVDSGEMAIAFAFYPTSIEDLMSVADANEVMPPKSTWFEPKLADGLVSYMLKDV